MTSSAIASETPQASGRQSPLASIISLVFTMGHTLGGRQEWSPMGENEVLRAMTTVRFDIMGANRSYLDFFMGFGRARSSLGERTDRESLKGLGRATSQGSTTFVCGV
jgi:hypothetical protein